MLVKVTVETSCIFSYVACCFPRRLSRGSIRSAVRGCAAQQEYFCMRSSYWSWETDSHLDSECKCQLFFPGSHTLSNILGRGFALVQKLCETGMILGFCSTLFAEHLNTNSIINKHVFRNKKGRESGRLEEREEKDFTT